MNICASVHLPSDHLYEYLQLLVNEIGLFTIPLSWLEHSALTTLLYTLDRIYNIVLIGYERACHVIDVLKATCYILVYNDGSIQSQGLSEDTRRSIRG